MATGISCLDSSAALARSCCVTAMDAFLVRTSSCKLPMSVLASNTSADKLSFECINLRMSMRKASTALSDSCVRANNPPASAPLRSSRPRTSSCKVLKQPLMSDASSAAATLESFKCRSWTRRSSSRSAKWLVLVVWTSMSTSFLFCKRPTSSCSLRKSAVASDISAANVPPKSITCRTWTCKPFQSMPSCPSQRLPAWVSKKSMRLSFLDTSSTTWSSRLSTRWPASDSPAATFSPSSMS
mmetsp:Transcript_87824/g.273195  ORF Transcript_87824/g.273195 Transcript_87824/m.273195 type:complete len:241 (+) Transcript_87824:1160-1882(+)